MAMSETESQRAARIADKYVAPDGGKPKRPKKGKGAGKPFRPDPDGTKMRDLLPAKIKPEPIKPRPYVRYSDELFRTIVQRVARGETVADICEDEAMPAEGTFYEWVQDDTSRNELYARAQWERTYVHLESVLEIADRATPETVNVARLRIDARKWSMSKVNPDAFMDRKAVEHVGGSLVPKARLNPRMLSESAREALREECRRILEERDANTIDVTPNEEKQA